MIPKPDGRQRPLGIAALEDKIVQGAVVALLTPIYEAEFLGFSYGFRPGRGQHDALDALAVGIERRRIHWILDADIRAFFDSLSHDWLMRFVEHRIGDKRILRLIRKWLKAGVLDEGRVVATPEGVPQGATISPLLANVYLHYVYDLWVQHWRRREARGDMIVVRYADDTIVGFEHQADAERFLAALKDRLAAFSLSLHPAKTRLIAFGRWAGDERARRGEGKPDTFDFLGFTHICAKTRDGLRFQLRRKTQRQRHRAKLKAVKDALRRNWRATIDQQGRWLAAVIRGHMAYFAVPTNSPTLAAFRHHLGRIWCRYLRRRSQRHRITWERMKVLVARYFPPVRVIHPWPSQRFDANHPREEPDAGIPLVRICAGGAQK
jgi:RNA-directed DNA polymerase